mmetsp:Transcript_68301/g.148683  ORF Transcript_68301/g.148683 Transcript_68301/m.148683 type:complete len:212 (-) Transcript_68301:1408-2043(-)
MSRPLAATSVATRIFVYPSRRSFNAFSRSRWSLSPWIESHLTLARFRPSSSCSHIFFVVQKMSARFSPLPRSDMSNWRNTFVSSLTLRSGSMIFTIWVMFSFAFRTDVLPICTWYGLRRKSEANFRTLCGQVAVKKRVCLSRGSSLRILRTWGSKPMSSIRSASSMTSLATLSSFTTSPPSRKSFNLPGVAIRIWHPRFKAPTCGPFGAPP